MKKAILAAVLLTAMFAAGDSSTASPAPRQYYGYGNKCCDRDPWTGYPRVRCYLDGVLPSGNMCWCYGIPGTGFVCR